MPEQVEAEDLLNKLLYYCGYEEKIEFKNPFRRMEEKKDIIDNDNLQFGGKVLIS